MQFSFGSKNTKHNVSLQLMAISRPWKLRFVHEFCYEDVYGPAARTVISGFDKKYFDDLAEQTWFSRNDYSVRVRDLPKTVHVDGRGTVLYDSYYKIRVLNAEMLLQWLWYSQGVYLLPAEIVGLRSNYKFLFVEPGYSFNIVGKNIYGSWVTGTVTFGHTVGTTVFTPDRESTVSSLQPLVERSGFLSEQLIYANRASSAYCCFIVDAISREFMVSQVKIGSFSSYPHEGTLTYVNHNGETVFSYFTLNFNKNTVEVKGLKPTAATSTEPKGLLGRLFNRATVQTLPAEQLPPDTDSLKVNELNRVKVEYGGFLADILTAVTLPALLDETNVYTSAFLNQLIVVEKLYESRPASQVEREGFNASVDRLVAVWEECVIKARATGLSDFTVFERRKISKASKLLSKAKDTNSPVERDVFLKKAQSVLKGVLVVPAEGVNGLTSAGRLAVSSS